MLLGQKIKELRDTHGVFFTLWIADKVLDAIEGEGEFKHAAIKIALSNIE